MMTMIQVETARFGCVESEMQDVVTFPLGMPGFDSLSRFIFIQHREGSPFRWMQSLDDGSLAFLVVDPATYLTDYAPLMPESLANELELTEETPRLVYTIVTIPRGKPEEMTLNLAGPIVVNAVSGKAAQVVIEDDAYPIRFRVLPEAAQSDAA